jgi:hypothetical protein
LVITLAVTLSQDHAAADDNVFQLNVFAQLQIFVQYVKLLAVTATLFQVQVAIAQLLRNHCPSFAL